MGPTDVLLVHSTLPLVLSSMHMSHNRNVQCDDLFVADLYNGKIFVALSGKFWHCFFFFFFFFLCVCVCVCVCVCFKNSSCRSFS